MNRPANGDKTGSLKSANPRREKREVIRRMAREAIEEYERGETLPLHDLL